MSKDNLANELDVSRQSVSKWETDTSISELGKLIRMVKFLMLLLMN